MRNAGYGRRSFDALMIVAAAVIAVRLVSAHRADNTVSTEKNTAAEEFEIPPATWVGRPMSFEGVNWSKHPEHVVVLLWTTCPSCVSHLPFYQEISQRARSGKFGFIVLALDPLSEMRSWLSSNNIEPEAVVRVDHPSKAGLMTTPTLLLVNSFGTVTDMWVSGMNRDVQLAWLDRLDNPRAGSRPELTNVRPVSEVSRAAFTQAPQGAVIIDTRQRGKIGIPSSFKAIHMPSDEITIRARKELPATGAIIIDCIDQRLLNCRTAARTLAVLGFPNLSIVTPH